MPGSSAASVANDRAYDVGYRMGRIVSSRPPVARPALCPKRLAGKPCTFRKACEFCPHDLRLDLRRLIERQRRRKATVAAGHYTLAPDGADKPHDPLGDKIGMLNND